MVLFPHSSRRVTKFDSKRIKRYEITEVYAHPEALVDICLVHGLNGDPYGTWTAKSNGTFWPTDLLPASLGEAKARILVYGYNANVWAFGGDRSASSDMIHQHAQTLVNSLALERTNAQKQENAIIWVAHSLGGILVKRALELSNDMTSRSADSLRSIYVSTYGIIFLGTPHTGADAAKWGVMLQSIANTMLPKKVVDTEPHLVRTLKSQNETLQNINLHFLDIYRRFEIVMIHEAVKTDFKGMKAYVVDQEAASPSLPEVRYYGIEANHSNICKFENKNSPGYLSVSTQLKSWIEESPTRIQSRLASERNARQQAKEEEARELLEIFDNNPQNPRQSAPSTPALSNSGIISTSIPPTALPDVQGPTDVYFIKPQGFRPNSLFVGRHDALDELHRMLFDKQRRSQGVAAVVLQSLPGGGKTHLARQYVYSHRDDFPGGIFWLSAKSRELLAAGYWDIAQKAVFQSPGQVGTHDSEQFISAVHDWFTTRHEWLIVFDGMKFEDTPELWQFIPDSTESSIIYTSREGDVGGDYRFMNPQVIRLPHLSPREAQDLFLLEIDKKQPSTEDRRHAFELVNRMDYLPLVIHAVAKRMKTTGEPLAKSARTYLSGPKLRDLDTYVTVVKDLESAGAYEALNLMYILCFFSQYIPVELIALGVRVLDVPVKAHESGTGRTLNNTFRILNRFALIDRSELEDIQSSQSSKSSREALPEELDVVKLHSVVQDFFVDFVQSKKEFQPRFTRAATVLAQSYKRASVKIRQKTNAGLVGDYRNYDVHATRMLDHLAHYEKKNSPLAEIRTVLEMLKLDITQEIKRRTPETSKELVAGRSNTNLTSIFDRTSSSSEAGPDTPESLEKRPTWSSWETDGKVESPEDLQHNQSHEQASDLYPGANPSLQRPRFGRYPSSDGGYDSDREDSVSTTIRPLNVIKQRSGSDDGGNWQVVGGPRRRRADLHRTTRQLENTRYRDRAGAWRSPLASDPRINSEPAEGFVHSTYQRPSFLGTKSTHSAAAVSLQQIKRNNRPPSQSGQVNTTRKPAPLRRPTLLDTSGRTTTGDSAYAVAETAQSNLTATPVPQSRPPPSDSPNLNRRPVTSAMESLQSIPRLKDYSGARDRLELTTRQSRAKQPYPSSDSDDKSFSQRMGSNNDEEYHGTSYARRTEPIPIEHFPSGSGAFNSERRPSDNIEKGRLRPPKLPIPGRDSSPRLSEDAPWSPYAIRKQYGEEGYTSQPMSREVSGRSQEARSYGNLETRRPSLVETEPPIQLPIFSPATSPTSYQLWEGHKKKEKTVQEPQISPRLALARARQTNWTGDRPLPAKEPSKSPQRFNPAAPVFAPRTQSQPPSRPLPHPLSNTSISQELPPMPQDRSLSPSAGGMIAGRRYLEFGSSGEPVDVDLARERVQTFQARKALESEKSRRETEATMLRPAAYENRARTRRLSNPEPVLRSGSESDSPL